MQYAKKYALVPEDTLSKHVPSQQHLSHFDQAMAKILTSNLPDHEKIQQYYKLLKRKMDMQEFNLPWMTHTEEKNETDEQETSSKHEHLEKNAEKEPPSPVKQEYEYSQAIINAVPRSFQKQAQDLLQFIKSHPNTLRWNNKGEMIYKNENLPDSNIADLFHLIFTHQKPKNLTAKTEFLQALQELNVPKFYVKNKALLETPVKHEIVSSPPNVKKRKHVSQKGKSIVKKWISYK